MATAGAASLGLPERVVLDAIQQFLAGREWRANVQRFVDSRCESFVGLEEHKHEQYDMFNVRTDSAHLGVAVQCSAHVHAVVEHRSTTALWTHCWKQLWRT